MLPCVGDLREGIQLRQLEKRLEIIVEVGETQLATLLPNLLRQGDEHAESRAVDIAGLAEVDEKFLLTLLELIEHFLLQLLAIPYNQLTFYIDHDHVSLFLDRETHSDVLQCGSCC